MRILTSILVFLILAGGTAYYFLKDKTYTLKFTEPQLRERLDEKLPFSEDYLSVFNVSLDNPRVDLVEGSDRVAGGIDAVVTARAFGREFVVSGAADVSGGVRYAPEEGAFYLNNPSIENVELSGLPNGMTNRANNALSQALSEFYRERPIYQLREEDMKQAAAKMVLRDVVVKDEVLHVTMGLVNAGE